MFPQGIHPNEEKELPRLALEFTRKLSSRIHDEEVLNSVVGKTVPFSEADFASLRRQASGRKRNRLGNRSLAKLKPKYTHYFWPGLEIFRLLSAEKLPKRSCL